MLSADKEYEFLTVVIFSLLGLLVTLSLMVRFPELGAVMGNTINSDPKPLNLMTAANDEPTSRPPGGASPRVCGCGS